MDEEEAEQLKRDHIKADAADAIAEERGAREWGWEEKERADYRRRVL